MQNSVRELRGAGTCRQAKLQIFVYENDILSASLRLNRAEYLEVNDQTDILEDLKESGILHR